MAPLRLTRERSDLARVLDVMGVGMLIPTPVLWACDVVRIVADRAPAAGAGLRQPAGRAVGDGAARHRPAHGAGGPWRRAVAAALAATVVHVLGVSSVVR